MPVNVCPSVIQAVLYSENKPLYVDIDEINMGMSPEKLEENIGDVSAVIAVHSYGIPCNIMDITGICRKHNKVLIEDCAQALGAHIAGQPMGSFGDAAIFSFGSGKIIDLKFGGAAVSENKGIIQRVKNCSGHMPKWNSELEKTISGVSSLHTSLYNKFYPDQIVLYSNMFRDAALSAKSAYMFRTPDDFPDMVHNALASLDDNLSVRQGRAKRFSDIFKENGIGHSLPGEGEVCWRFNLYLRSNRDKILHTLLDEGFKVSSWYPRVDLFFEEGASGRKHPAADIIGSRILNLWVNAEVDDSYVDQISKRIINISNSLAEKSKLCV